MAQSHFEKLIDDAKRDLAELMFKLTAGDSHGHAELKGKRMGLDLALNIYRKATKTDPDEGLD